MALTQQDVEAWIAQQGGQARVQYSRGTKKVPNPAAQLNTPDGSKNPSFSPLAPDTIEASEEKWTAVSADGKPTGAVLHASRRPDGEYDIIDQQNPNPTSPAGRGGTTQQVEGTPDPSKEGGFDNARPRMVTRSADGAITEARPLTKAEREEWQGVATGQEGTPIGSEQTTDAQGRTVKTTTYKRPDGSTYTRQDSVQAAPEKPQVITSTVNTTSPRQGVLMPDGSIQWSPNPNYQNPDPKPIAIPGNPRNVIWDDGPGKPIRVEKNPLYEKPSKVQYDEKTGRYIEITVDDDGKPIVRDVDRQTTIKPADLPVLQGKYGEIAQGLGRLAQELNQRVARQEMTPQERTEAFTAAYKQAETQVSEINSILENSKAIWSGQVQQRGQSLSETQSRRSFASDAAGRAITTGYNIATSAGPGHGKQIAAGVEALMGMQERYAQGMGGFRESPEIGLPPALEQARGIGLPGYPLPSAPQPLGPASSAAGGGTPPAASGPAGPPNAIGAGAIGTLEAPGAPPSGADVAAANAATQAQSSAAFGRLGIPPPGNGISNTTDAGGVPREYTPASVTGGGSGQPPVAAMGAALGAGAGYAGAPVAGGGAGMWDPSLAAQGMLGQGSDPAWEEAVRRAAGSFGRYG